MGGREPVIATGMWSSVLVKSVVIGVVIVALSELLRSPMK